VAELSVHAFTVYDLITRGAAGQPDEPAVIQGDRTVSFRELRERVDALAAGLAGLGIARGERICVLAQNDAAYVDLYGACARQGIVAYPINWRLTGPEVERVVERARPAMMVVDQTTLPLNGQATVRAIVIESAGTPVHNGTQVTFATILGSFNPPTSDTVDGVATTTFFAGSISGSTKINAYSGGASTGLATNTYRFLSGVSGAK